MSFVIIGIILLVLANTMIMSARERTHEYAVLKTLGFTGRHIFLLIVGESLILSFIGSALGMAVTVPAVEAFQSALPKGWFPVFYIEPRTILFGCVAGIAVGLCASLIPARRAMSSKIVEGVRYVG
jgi:putative ABC transport system permease protein